MVVRRRSLHSVKNQSYDIGRQENGAEAGYESTTQYLKAAAKAVFEETGLLPHANPGNLEPEELADLREVSPSMGIMLSQLPKGWGKGMPHYGSPDKAPSVRLQTLRNAGIAKVPFTTEF